MEINFFVEGRYCYLVPHPPFILVEQLKRGLSYTKKNSQFLSNPSWGVVKLYDEKRHRYPIGLHFLVQKIIGLADIPSLVRPDNVFYGILRLYQRDALDAMLKHSHGILSIPTGGGKTRVALQYMKNVPVPTLVLVPTLDLVSQWEKQVPEFAHVKTYQSIKKKDYLAQFKAVIFDECHHVAAKTLYRIGINLSANTSVFGLSATPLLRDDDNLKVQAVLGQIIYKVSNAELTRQGYLAKCKIHMIDTLQPYDAPLHLSYAGVYEAYIISNQERNETIKDLVKTLTGRTLILVNRIFHGVMLNALIPESIFLSGQSSKELRDNPDADVIIATQIYDEGVDMPDLNNLIVAGGGKSQIKTIQRVGRTLRPHADKPHANVYDFYDKTKWLDKHSRERKKVYDDCFGD